MPKINIHLIYMEIANSIKKCSYAQRDTVGAVITKDTRIISTGYNGMPSGMSNMCEDSTWDELLQQHIVVTKSDVVHAEANAIAFAAKHGISTLDCTIYVTRCPCVDCAKLIIQSGIKEVIYEKPYRDAAGIDLLVLANINVVCIKNLK